MRWYGPVLWVVSELAGVAGAGVRSGDLRGLEREGEEVVHVPVSRKVEMRERK